MVILIYLTNQILIIVSDTSQSITSRFLNAQNIRTRCTDTALRISIRSIFVVTLVGKNRFFFPEGTYLFKKKKKKKKKKKTRKVRIIKSILKHWEMKLAKPKKKANNHYGFVSH